MNRLFNKNGSIQRNMIGSAICKPISILISYFYIPIVLSYLGVEKYGVWATILSILSWISYFDIGIGNGLRNKLTESITKNNGNGKHLVSSAYAFISVITAVIVIIFSLLASFLNWNTILGVTEFDENLNAIVMTAFIFVAVNFVLSLCKNILYAYQKAAIVSGMELSSQMLNFAGVLIVKNFTSGNLFLLAVIYGLSMLSVEIVVNIAIFAKHRDIAFAINSIDFNSGRKLLNLGLGFFIIQICALVLFTTDNLIISSLYGASDVTPYNTINKLFSVIIQVHTALLAPIWSIVTKIKVENNYKKVSKLIRDLNLLVIPFAFGIVLLAIIFKPLSAWWLGQELNYTSGLIPLGAAYAILSIWCNTYAYVSNGLEIIKPSIIVSCIEAILNIPLSVTFAKGFGMGSTGVLLGTIVAMSFAACTGPYFVHKEIKTNEHLF